MGTDNEGQANNGHRYSKAAKTAALVTLVAGLFTIVNIIVGSPHLVEPYLNWYKDEYFTNRVLNKVNGRYYCSEGTYPDEVMKIYRNSSGEWMLYFRRGANIFGHNKVTLLDTDITGFARDKKLNRGIDFVDKSTGTEAGFFISDDKDVSSMTTYRHCVGSTGVRICYMETRYLCK